MQTYMIVGRDDGAGYNVELTDAIGVHHTMLGFETEAEAQVWIEQDQRVSIGVCSGGCNYEHCAADRCCLNFHSTSVPPIIPVRSVGRSKPRASLLRHTPCFTRRSAWNLRRWNRNATRSHPYESHPFPAVKGAGGHKRRPSKIYTLACTSVQ